MIKLKLLIEKKKKEKKSNKLIYPEIIMLPDTVMDFNKFIKFLKTVYNIEIKINK